MQRSKLAQNRIDYIVYGNPAGVGRLIYDLGYEKPKGLQNLLKASKLLVKKEGKTMIHQLVKLHPDRNAILSLEKPEEDSYCGVCGHHNYTEKEPKEKLLDDLDDMSDRALERYYEKLLKKYQLNPDDVNLEEEIQSAWKELRQRLRAEDGESPTGQSSSDKKREGLLILSLTLLAGILLGLSFKKKRYA